MFPVKRDDWKKTLTTVAQYVSNYKHPKNQEQNNYSVTALENL